jgi:F-type H+-transporting ATPase subunit delta
MAAITSRYARAFADVVVDLKLDPAQMLQQLNSIVELTSATPELRIVWENPAIPAEQKRKLLDAIAQRAGISKQVRNLVAVIIDHRRVRFVGDIARQVELELNNRLGFADAEVTSARELSTAERQRMEAQIAGMTGKKVRARYGTDSKILGGAVVKLGSTVYDGSVRGQLLKLKEQLEAAE